MCKPTRHGRYQTKDPYLELLEQTIRHAESLQKQLHKIQGSYPVGSHTKRDIIRIRSCILCALENLMH